MSEENTKNPDSLETITITNKNYKQKTGVLSDTLAYLLTTYLKNKAKDKVISPDDVIDLLSEKKKGVYVNDAYRWTIIKKKDKIVSGYHCNDHPCFIGVHKRKIKGKIVGVVAYDVWNVPENEGVQFTPIYYLAADEGYEGAVNHIINTDVLHFATEYSGNKDKRNVGFLTDETTTEGRKRILKGLVEHFRDGGYLYRKIGVPTLGEIAEKDYRKVNFKTKGHVDIVLVPVCKGMTTDLAKKMVLGYLDQGYNSKQPGDEGYTPLSEMESYKKFARNLDEQFPGGIVKLKLIR